MKREFFGILFVIGAGAVCFIGYSLACDDTLPKAELTSPGSQSICVSEPADLNAVGTEEDETGSYDEDNGPPYGGGHGISIYGWWFGDGNEWDYDSGGKPNDGYDAPGVYTVSMCVYDDDLQRKSDTNIPCTVYVVEVNKVEDAFTGIEDHIYVSTCTTAYLLAIANPSYASWPQKQPRWSIVSQPEGADAKVSPWWFDPWDPNDRWGPVATVTDMNVVGDYTFQAACGADDPPDNNMVVTAVAVESLLADAGVEVDDSDGDSNTKSYVVSIVDPNTSPNYVTVTATPNPGDVPEANLPPGWTLTGGTGTDKLTRTVSRTSAAKTVITCTSGCSTKTTRIYVVNVDIIAGLSEPNELKPGMYINVNWNDDDGDGWEPNETPPDAHYTPDKDDPNIDRPDGDGDLQPFWVLVTPTAVTTDLPDTKLTLSFASNVRLWDTKNKLYANGASSQVTSGEDLAVGCSPYSLYLEGVAGSTTFRDVELKATYVPCDTNDIVKVTVFEVVDINGLFAYGDQQNDNEARFSDPNFEFKQSSDKDGRISWDDADGDANAVDEDPNCEYFHNCMEFQGRVRPSGVTTEVAFNIKRDRWARCWSKMLDANSWGEPDDDSTPWKPDDPYNYDEDLTPSGTNHIYQIDGPGFTTKERDGWDCLAYIGNFREWVAVEIDGVSYQCSDYYRWHSKLYTKPKPSTQYMTRNWSKPQELGGGWVSVPEEAD